LPVGTAPFASYDERNNSIESGLKKDIPVKDEFDNGKEYLALLGKTILLPGNPVFRLSAEQLGLHNENVYRPG
jgi:hypothetical protein